MDNYGVHPKTDLRESMSVVCTDFIFGCSSRNASRVLHSAGVPVYQYIFDYAFTYEDGWGEGPIPCKGRVCHGGELLFIFKTAALGGYRETPAEVRLTDSTMSYYANFVYTGDPNDNTWSGESREAYEYWPDYSQANN